MYSTNNPNPQGKLSLLTEKGITTEGLHPEFLKILEGSQYDIGKALINSIKENVESIPYELVSLLNQETLSLALIEGSKLGLLSLAERNKLDAKDGIGLKDVGIIKALLANGANPNFIDADGNTALHLITLNYSEGSIKILETLLSQTVINPNIPDNNGNTALHLAAKEGYPEKIEILLAKKDGIKTELNLKNKNGDTPLHLAIRDGTQRNEYLEIVKLLLTNGADLNIQNNDGKTPRDLATNLVMIDTLDEIEAELGKGEINTLTTEVKITKVGDTSLTRS